MPYPGGKAAPGAYQRLINLMPPHTVYLEPFLGGGAVMGIKRPARRNIGVDLDDQVVAAWASRAGVEVVHGCGIAFLRSHPFAGDEMVYCDPPYVQSTRSGRRVYDHELSDEQHAALLEVILGLPCRVMISGYWSTMYGDALAGWEHETYAAMTRGGRQAVEHVWFNYPRPVELHDYRFLGDSFRERERIKRKKLRWTKRLQGMPTLERQALLSAIAEVTAADVVTNGGAAGGIAKNDDAGSGVAEPAAPAAATAVPAVYRTPGTKLEWSDLAGWLEAACRIERRRPSQARHDAIAAHMAALPIDLVDACADADILAAGLAWWTRGPSGFGRPHRGHRATAPQTPLIVAAKNRLTQLSRNADLIPAGDNWRAMHGPDGTTVGEGPP